MKKIILMATVAFIATTVVSCKKNWTCECKTNCGGYIATASATRKDTKKNAKEWCEQSATSGTCTTTCELK